MKKIITLLLAGLLLGTTVLFAACGTNNDESSTAASDDASSAAPADGSSETETSSEAETSSEPEESTGIPAQDPAVEEIESYPMTLEMTSDTMFKMSCTDELGKPFSTTFTKKSWGTWNIADWIYDGTAFTGGVGTIFGTFLGMLVLQGFKTGLNMVGLQTFWQQVAKGALLVVALTFDFYRKKTREKKLLEESKKNR